MITLDCCKGRQRGCQMGFGERERTLRFMLDLPDILDRGWKSISSMGTLCGDHCRIETAITATFTVAER